MQNYEFPYIKENMNDHLKILMIYDWILKKEQKMATHTILVLLYKNKKID